MQFTSIIIFKSWHWLAVQTPARTQHDARAQQTPLPHIYSKHRHLYAAHDVSSPSRVRWPRWHAATYSSSETCLCATGMAAELAQADRRQQSIRIRTEPESQSHQSRSKVFWYLVPSMRVRACVQASMRLCCVHGRPHAITITYKFIFQYILLDAAVRAAAAARRKNCCIQSSWQLALC